MKWLRLEAAGDTCTTHDTRMNLRILNTILLPDGKAWQFYYPMDVKSVITQPSPGLKMQGAGLYQISGLAWSGKGKINKVEVSADAGRSWAPAALQEPILPIAFTRFHVPWKWDGGPAHSKAGRQTRLAMSSRPVSIRLRSAVTKQSITITPSIAGL